MYKELTSKVLRASSYTTIQIVINIVDLGVVGLGAANVAKHSDMTLALTSFRQSPHDDPKNVTANRLSTSGERCHE